MEMVKTYEQHILERFKKMHKSSKHWMRWVMLTLLKAIYIIDGGGNVQVTVNGGLFCNLSQVIHTAANARIVSS